MSQKKIKVIEIVDEKGKSIGNIVGLVAYLKGIVVGTNKGLYTNVKSLLKDKNLLKVK